MKKLSRIFLLLLLALLLTLPCHAEDAFFEDTVTVYYMRHGRSQKQEVPFRINVQNGQELSGPLFLQVETDADVFLYLTPSTKPLAPRPNPI